MTEPSADEEPAAQTPRRARGFGPLATALSVLVAVAAGHAVIASGPPLVADEGFHAPQVWALFFGRWEVLATTPMLPTYHALLALAERVAGEHDERLLRLLSLAGSLGVPLLVWRGVALHEPREAGRRTLQWVAMPLLFPLLLLIYTDAWALAAVLGTLLAALRGRWLLAGAAGLLATLLRQDMVIWVAMAWVIVVAGDGAAGPRQPTTWPERRAAFARGLPLLATLVAFAVFVRWNGGVALGDRAHHPLAFSVTNVACLLLCAWLVFLPQNLQALPRIAALLRRRPALLAVAVAAFVIYAWRFDTRHPFNGLRFYLHNEAVYWLRTERWVRALAFVPMAWMALTLAVTRLADPRLRLLYVVAPLSAGLHGLIEPRYYLPALTLFHVWRPSAGSRCENVTLAMYALLSALVVWGIATERFFL